MAVPTPFSLRIFVADGDPDGLRLVERSNWVGKGVIFPRTLFPEIKTRGEFGQTGVYLLLGLAEDGANETIYIGEGDPVRPRLESHFAKKEFWTRAVFFVAGSGQLNKAHVQFLESQLIKRATAAKRVLLDNGNVPTEPSLSEADRADMEVFLINMLSMLPVLGIQAFESPATATPARGREYAPTRLTCRGKGVLATGHETTQGFVVKADSEAVGDQGVVPSMKVNLPSVYRTRQLLIENGVLQSDGKRLKFSQDYTFTSPSLAAAVILGHSSNGRIDWKDAHGKTLKELQTAQAEV
jgi:hypothetical protein